MVVSSLGFLTASGYPWQGAVDTSSLQLSSAADRTTQAKELGKRGPARTETFMMLAVVRKEYYSLPAQSARSSGEQNFWPHPSSKDMQ